MSCYGPAAVPVALARSMSTLIYRLLPALIPSWRFFKEVGPSPRVEYRLITGEDADRWVEAFPRPATLSPLAMLSRLFWNPDWNDQLFLVSCAERMVEAPSDHSLRNLNERIARRLDCDGSVSLQIRLIFVTRAADGVARTTLYESTPTPLAEVRG